MALMVSGCLRLGHMGFNLRHIFMDVLSMLLVSVVSIVIHIVEPMGTYVYAI